MHLSLLYNVLSQEETNIFINISEQSWWDLRKMIIKIILGKPGSPLELFSSPAWFTSFLRIIIPGTDMARYHSSQTKRAQDFGDLHGEDVRDFCTGRTDEIR